MPAVLTPIVHHVELESEIDGNRVGQRQHQAGFLWMEDSLAIALNSAMAHRESLDLAGQRLAGRIPAELAGAQLLALQPEPDFYELGFESDCWPRLVWARAENSYCWSRRTHLNWKCFIVGA